MTENLSILNTMLHTWSDEEVTLAWRMIADEGKRRKEVKTKKLKGTLIPGDKVEYQSRRTGTTRGHIVKVKTKNALVEVNGQQWNVPMSMLKKI
jgi:dsDNA-specific endonuclease/ATPase MutS2